MVPFGEVRHRADWEGWQRLTRGAAPYLTPEFFALTRRLIDGGEAFVAEAWQDGALAGALPLVLSERTLRPLRSSHSPGFDYVGSCEGLDAIWRTLCADRRWDQLLADVPARSLLASRLVENARADGCPAVIAPSRRQPFFALRGFEARMSRKFLTNLKRCARKAGGVALERIETPRGTDLEAAFALEARAWKAAAGSNITADRRVEHLYRAMTRLFGPRHQAALSFLRAGGERIAALITVEDAIRLYALKIGYDPRHADASPGHLLVWLVAADAERRGLAELDFVGNGDDWKHKWTGETHQEVSLRVYRRSPRGLLLYALRERAKPLLPVHLRHQLRTPLRHGCQRDDILGVHSLLRRARGRLQLGLGVRSGLKRALLATPATFGEPSRFAVGSWVRVGAEADVRATLDAHQRLRGLAFLPQQWSTCGRVYRVERHLRRLRDDGREMRPVSRTVLLENVTCTGSDHRGCGRHCPLMYRDEWLAPAAAPTDNGPTPPTGARRAHVRDVEQIRRGLDLFGKRDGLTFMREMEALCGKRFPVVHQLPSVFEHGATVRTRAPLYVLEAPRCSGGSLGAKEKCDRACAFLWHADWLVLEDSAAHHLVDAGVQRELLGGVVADEQCV